MRNLKKILALVLAMVMSFSIMTISSAAFKDEASISENYAESIEVLDYIGVFRGDETGNFNPKKNITRAEVATIIYRIVTGDVEDDYANNYADLNMFSDVKSSDWFAGYVNYCASAEYIKGRGDGTFDPQGKITGYDAMTMILRAIGYDQNGEFTGETYTVKVASVAQERGITDTLKGVALGSPATREVIAEILFRTINVPQVSYTLAFGYSVYVNPLQTDGTAAMNETLGYENFDLWFSGDLEYDEWGVPYTERYFIDVDDDKECDYWEDYYGTLLTWKDYDPVAEYFTAVPECDIAKDLGIATSYPFVRVTENGTPDPSNICGEFDGTINATETKKLVGRQGRWTRVFQTKYGLEMVMMDQFLGQVVDVTEIGYDRNNHVQIPAYFYINVWDDSLGGVTQIRWANYNGNFDYTVGEFLLLNHEATLSGAIVGSSVSNTTQHINLGAPEALTGAQTAYTTKDSHIVNGVEYPDAYRFYLDQAGTETGNHTWLFDTYGNLIGVVDIYVANTYGTITAIKWVDEYNTLNAGYALASITYMDGSSETIKIYAIRDVGAGTVAADGSYIALQGIEGKGTDATDYQNGMVSSTTQYNSEYCNRALYKITTDGRGRVYLDAQIYRPDAFVTNGVPALDSRYYAGNTTQFLVLSAYTYQYETYVGIKNVPSYVEDTGDYWIVDENGDYVAEYVFIIYPEVASAVPYYGTFFAYGDDNLVVTTALYANNKYYYTISGGLVNGVAGDLITFDPAVVQEIMAYKGILMKLTYSDDWVIDASRVTTWYESNTPARYQYAVYAQDANDAWIIDGVLFADGEAYDIEGAEVITEYRNRNLADIIKYADPGEYYLYIIYTYENNTKAALTVYISDVPGYTYEEILTEDVENAMANVKAIQAKLDAAAEKLANGEGDAEELKAEIEELKADLEEAIQTLKDAIDKAKEEGAYVPKDADDVVDTAKGAIEDAIEAVIAFDAPESISVDPVSFVYDVNDDALAIKITAETYVKREVGEIEDIAALVEMGAAVKVETDFDFTGKPETNEVPFTVTITYGDFVKTYTITVTVTAKVSE